MTLDRELDRQLVLYLDGRAAATPPADLLSRSLSRVEATSQRPDWLVGGLAPRRTVALGRTLVPAWAILALVAIAVAALIVVGSQLVRLDQPVVAPAPSDQATTAITTPAPTEPPATPTATPGPLGGGPILGFKSTGDHRGPFDVVAIDPATGGTTLLGRLPVTESCCGYQFLRNPDLSRVVIVDGALQNPTPAAEPFGFVSLSNSDAAYEWLALSPAGDRIAGVRTDLQDSPVEIVVMNLAGAVQTRVPIPSTMNWAGPLVWAPEGESLLLTGCRPCNKAATPGQKQTAHHSHLYIVPIDGSPWTELLDLDNGQLNAAWSPDGDRLAVEGYPCAAGSFMPRCDPAETRDTLSVVDLASGAETTLLMDLPAITGVGWSPDGTDVSFASMNGTWVVDAASGTAIRVDDAHSFSADWSPDGLWLVVGHEVPGPDSEHVVVRADGSRIQITLTNDVDVAW